MGTILGCKYKDFDKTTQKTIDVDVEVLNMLLQGKQLHCHDLLLPNFVALPNLHLYINKNC